MNRLLLLAGLLVACAGTAWAGPACDAAARASAGRISDELDRALRRVERELAVERSLPAGAVRLESGTVLFLDGAELPFDELELLDPVGVRRVRRPARTDTLLRVIPGTTLSLANLSGDITVTSWDRNEVHIEAEHDRGDDLITELRDSRIKLGVLSRRGAPADVEWTLTVPRWLPLELSGIESEITVSGLRSPVRAQSMRGDVTVVNCQGPLEVNSVEGEVHVSDVSGNVTAGSVNNVVRILRVVGSVEAQTINGDIQLEKIESASVDASTVNGRVYYASRYQPRGRYSLSSHNGRVLAPVPSDQNVKVSLSSFHGQVESSIPVPKRAPRAKWHSYSFHVRDGVAVEELPEVPETPRVSRVTPAPPAAPRLELESFGGLIRLASQEEVLNALTARRAALDSARSLHAEGRRKLEQAQRILRDLRARERQLESRRRAARAPEPTPPPETPPPPPGD